jgi:serine/threonine protein kinase
MLITSPLLIPPEVVLAPVEQLPDRVRSKLTYSPGDVAITRMASRVPSKIISAEMAAFLEEFKTSTTIVDAVVRYTRDRRADPESTLEEVFPLVKRLLNQNLLVPAEEQSTKSPEVSLKAGTQIGEWSIIQCIQWLEDSSVFQVRKSNDVIAVLKMLHFNARLEQKEALDREVFILRRLDGTSNPSLLTQGTYNLHHYLVLEWVRGTPITVAALELRNSKEPARRALLDLACAVVEAYAHLHRQGVIHSDVHPRNVLVTAKGEVKVIDFGLARVFREECAFSQSHRGGVGFFFEPEYARALLANRQSPNSTELGEQFSLAALLYLLFTGEHYLQFSLERREMLRQIAEDSMLPFSKQGQEAWPGLEQILAKALSKEPQERFTSMAELAAALRSENEPPKCRSAAMIGLRSASEQLLSRFLSRVQVPGPLFSNGVTKAPLCSVNYGAGGIAYALYRIACARGDDSLLWLADLWVSKALRDSSKAFAFENPDIPITQAEVGEISPYHTLSGLFCVQALISHAMGDLLNQLKAAEAFVNASTKPCRNLDLTLGKSSTLLACCILLEALQDSTVVFGLGNAMFVGLCEELNSVPRVTESNEFRYLGIAHGSAGMIYALIRWCQTTGKSPPSGLQEWLDQIGRLAVPKGRGLYWPLSGRKGHEDFESHMAGWCHGSAGYVHLWTLAHELFEESQYLRFAEQAAWNAWEEPASIASLCCGLAGRAYSLLNLHRHIREKTWLERAVVLAERAAEIPASAETSQDSLYKGQTGIALLVSELADPTFSRMPFFEDEGWR